MIEEYDGNNHVSYVNNPEAYIGRFVSHYSLGNAQIVSAAKYHCIIQITGGGKVSSLWNEFSLLSEGFTKEENKAELEIHFVDCDNDKFWWDCKPKSDRIFLHSEELALVGLTKEQAKQMRKDLKKLIRLIPD